MYISMMEAYAIEALKKDGFTYDTVIQALNTNEPEQVQLLKSLYEKNDGILQQAFNGQYKVSFVTINGLKNLLNIRFNVNPKSYRVEANGLYDIEMNKAIEKEIADFISPNWTIKRQDEHVSIFVEGRRV